MSIVSATEKPLTRKLDQLGPFTPQLRMEKIDAQRFATWQRPDAAAAAARRRWGI